MKKVIKVKKPKELTTATITERAEYFDMGSNSTSTYTPETTTLTVEKELKVFPFSVNLGREELNQLAAKVNEIIAFINK